MPEPALDQLIETLIHGTDGGTVLWQEATGDGNSFVTQRRSGTITIQRRTGLSGTLAGQIELVVRDGHGVPITDIHSPTPADAVSGAVSKGAGRLMTLFNLVSGKHTGDHAALQRLISEFKEPR